MIDDPTDLLARLVAIPSVNPALVPGAAGEGAIARFCAEWLAEHGFEVRWLEATAGRPSVVGVARGSGGGRSLLFNGHLDTVTLAGYDGDPLAAIRRQGRLYGRGACDMKSGLAAMLIGAARARERGLAGDLLVACVADEEHGSLGTEELVWTFRADAAIVAEPTLLDLVIAHQGFVWFDVIIHGRSAHGSRPDLGVDAIAKAGGFLSRLQRWAARLRTTPAHPRLGRGSVHASLIAGGQEFSSYPAECRIGLERRTLPGETAETVREELEAILRAAAAEDPELSWEVVAGLERAPFEIAEEAPLVVSAGAAVQRRLGRAPALLGMPYWTDCAILAGAGIPSLLLGPVGEGAHAREEWVDLRSLEQTADIFGGLAVDFCGES